MNKRNLIWDTFSSFLLATVCLVGFSALSVDAQWQQWGGQNGNFQVAATELSRDWGEAGPKTLWCRDLGEGYSAISVDDGVL